MRRARRILQQVLQFLLSKRLKFFLKTCSSLFLSDEKKIPQGDYTSSIQTLLSVWEFHPIGRISGSRTIPSVRNHTSPRSNLNITPQKIYVNGLKKINLKKIQKIGVTQSYALSRFYSVKIYIKNP